MRLRPERRAGVQSQSAVSHQVHKLEQHLGQPLFVRRTRANALLEFESLGIAAITQRIGMLSDRLRRELQRLPGLQLQDLGSPGQQSGLIAFTLEGWDGQALKEELARRGINIGANGVNYTPLDMQARSLGSIARIALSYFNTQEEIECLLQALAELAGNTRS